jgi:hypothetical protein
MANTRNGNTLYVDATGDIIASPIMVTDVYLTATAANAIAVLADANGTSLKFNLRVATSGDTKHFPMSAYFPNGLDVTTLTNAILTVVYSSK